MVAGGGGGNEDKSVGVGGRGGCMNVGGGLAFLSRGSQEELVK